MSDQRDREPPSSSAIPDEVDELLIQQAQLQSWLGNLDEHSADVPARVAARVRGDYQARLDGVVERLAGHQDAIRADLDRLRDELRAAEQRHEETGDELEEYRLRHRIGELDDDAWGERRADLEAQVEVAAAAEAAARGEVRRLEELLEQFEPAPEPDPEPVSDGAAEAELAAPSAEPEPDPALPAAEAEPDPPRFAWETEPQRTAPEDDLDFLTGLDRAISTPVTPPVGVGDASDAGETEETRPRPGAKCPECGYTNDSTAWYCGVCGVDLA